MKKLLFFLILAIGLAAQGSAQTFYLFEELLCGSHEDASDGVLKVEFYDDSNKRSSSSCESRDDDFDFFVKLSTENTWHQINYCRATTTTEEARYTFTGLPAGTVLIDYKVQYKDNTVVYQKGQESFTIGTGNTFSIDITSSTGLSCYTNSAAKVYFKASGGTPAWEGGLTGDSVYYTSCSEISSDTRNGHSSSLWLFDGYNRAKWFYFFRKTPSDNSYHATNYLSGKGNGKDDSDNSLGEYENWWTFDKKGLHTITITDNNGCMATRTFITPGPLVVDSLFINVAATSATGLSDGAATVTLAKMVKGTGSYYYSFDGAAATTNPSITGLAVGQHSVTVTDECGNTATKSFVINSTLDANAFTATATAPTTFNGNDGTITINVVDYAGVGTLQYSIDGTNYQPSNTFNGLQPGTYTLYIKDNNTTITKQIVVPNRLFVDSIANDTVCYGGKSTLTASAHGGFGTYSYAWRLQGSSDVLASTASYTVAPQVSSTYTVVVSDESGDSVVSEASVVVYYAAGTSYADSAYYAYTWNDAAAHGHGTDVAYTQSQPAVVGNAYYTAEGCESHDTLALIIKRFDWLGDEIVDTTLYEPTGNGLNNGKIDVKINAPAVGNFYAWIEEITPKHEQQILPNGLYSFVGLPAGTYTLKVRYEEYDTATYIIVIGQPDLLVATVGSDTAVCPGTTVKVGVSAVGGVGSYTYTWHAQGQQAVVANTDSITVSPAATTTYVAVVTDANGNKDSNTAVVTILPTYSTTADSMRCDNDLAFSWNGVDFTTVGTQQTTLTAANGCDSVVAMTLAAYPTYNQQEAVAIVQNSLNSGYVWRDTTFMPGTTTSDHDFVRTSINGCDSLVTLHLAVYANIDATVYDTACDSFSITVFGGTVYNVSKDTVVVDHNYSRLGADSVVSHIITILDSRYVTDSRAVCSNELPVTAWNDSTFVEAGSKQATLRAANGCDSVVNMVLTVNESYSYIADNSACDQFVWSDGTVFTTDADTTFSYKSQYGCDSLVHLQLVMNHKASTRYNDTAYYYYIWTDSVNHGNALCASCHMTGNHAKITLASNSVVGTFQPLPVYSSWVRLSDSSRWFGIADSLTTIHQPLGGTVSPQLVGNIPGWEAYNDSLSHGANAIYGSIFKDSADAIYVVGSVWIDSDSVAYLAGVELTESGLYVGREYYSESGCPSRDTLALAIIPYDWHNGSIVDTTVTKPTGFGLADGTLEVRLDAPLQGNYYVWLDSNAADKRLLSNFDTTLFDSLASGIYYLKVAFEQFDTAIYEIRIDQPAKLVATGSPSQELCASTTAKMYVSAQGGVGQYSYSWHKKNATEVISTTDTCVVVSPDRAGTYAYVAVVTDENSVVDSVEVVINVDTVYAIIENQSACDSFTWSNGTTYFASAIDTAAYLSVKGCDSIHYLNLVVVYTGSTTFADTAYYTYTWDAASLKGNASGLTYTASGKYVGSQYKVEGLCPSYDTLDLTIKTINWGSTVVDTNITIPSGPGSEDGKIELDINGPVPGNYYAWIDEIVPHNDVLLSQFDTTQFDSLLAGVYTVGIRYEEFDTFYIYVTLSQPEELFVKVNNDTAVCAGATVDLAITATNGVVQNFSYAWIVEGLDGAITTEPAIRVVADMTTTYVLWVLDGRGGIASDTVTITALQHDGVKLEATACDSYIWMRDTVVVDTIKLSNTYTDTYTNANQCQVTDTLVATINSSAYTELHEVGCNAYHWADSTFVVSTLYHLDDTTAEGCPDIYDLYLVINYSDTTTDSYQQCDSMRWALNGMLYTVSNNTDTVMLRNVSGCDSVVRLDLTLGHSNGTVDQLFGCDSLRWANGTLYIEPNNTDTIVLRNASGCDSVITLNLTLGHANAAADTHDVCDALRWNGTLFTADTNTATFTTLNASGCDSTTTLVLFVDYSSVSIEEVKTCDSYYWTRTDSVYTESTDSAYTAFTAQNGCDSAFYLHLTLGKSYQHVIDTTVCDSITIDIYGLHFAFDDDHHGNYPVHRVEDGCDTNVRVDLVVNHSVRSDLFVSTDDGFYFWSDSTYTATGDYMLLFDNYTEDGCDSVAYLHLVIKGDGIDDVETIGISLYPNPTTGRVAVQADNVQRVEVMDLFGRRVAEFGATNAIDISHLAMGTYTLRITTANGVALQRIVKR